MRHETWSKTLGIVSVIKCIAAMNLGSPIFSQLGLLSCLQADCRVNDAQKPMASPRRQIRSARVPPFPLTPSLRQAAQLLLTCGFHGLCFWSLCRCLPEHKGVGKGPACKGQLCSHIFRNPETGKIRSLLNPDTEPPLPRSTVLLGAILFF